MIYYDQCSSSNNRMIIQLPIDKINKIVTSNNRNLVTSKKPGTVLLMQNVDLGHTKVIQIR